MSTFIHRSLSGGEIAPELYPRVDLAKYQTAVRLGRNCITPRTGGLSNRPGTQFVGEVGRPSPYTTDSASVRLIPFVISQDESYILEFGNGYIRIIFQGEYLTWDSSIIGSGTVPITAMTNANPGVFTSASHGMTNGTQIILRMPTVPEINGQQFIVTNVTTNTFELNYLDNTVVDTTAMETYGGSGGTVGIIFSMTSPYSLADLPYLKYAQNYKGLVLAHNNYKTRQITTVPLTIPPFQLSEYTTYTADIGTPTGLAASGVSSGTAYYYSVTALGIDGEESENSNEVGISAAPSSGSPLALTWNEVTGAYAYNVYVKNPFSGGNVGFFYLLAKEVPYPSLSNITSNTPPSGTAQSLYPQSTGTPLISPGIDGAGNGGGAAVAFFQQRCWLGSLYSNPEYLAASWIGHYNDFWGSQNPTDNTALAFNLAGNKVNDVQHFVGLSTFFILTKSTEFVVNSQGGAITPTNIDVVPFSYYGSWYTRPIEIGQRFLFVQRSGSIIRDFGFEYVEGNYKGNDITIFATHLFNGFTVADWCYAQMPNSILWVVRSDGALLSCTYIQEEQILAWTRHDFTNGFVENVCSIPEENGDAVYIVVRRTINGRTTRYVERLPPDYITDVRDFQYMDACLTYDGRNYGATTMTLSGGSQWLYTETLTLTASASFFSSSNIGDQMQLNDANGNQIRFTITGYSSATVVTGNVNRTVPATLQNTAITNWAHAVQKIYGLRHLQGQQVSILGDGFVDASPNNPTIPTVVTMPTNGILTLAEPRAVVQIGLPFVSDIEALDVDMPQGETMADKRKIISKVTVYVNRTRGLWAGNNPNDPVALTGLDEFKMRCDDTAYYVPESNYDLPIPLATDQMEINIQPASTRNGRVFIRQVDPLPMTICAIAPAGLIPTR